MARIVTAMIPGHFEDNFIAQGLQLAAGIGSLARSWSHSRGEVAVINSVPGYIRDG